MLTLDANGRPVYIKGTGGPRGGRVLKEIKSTGATAAVDGLPKISQASANNNASIPMPPRSREGSMISIPIEDLKRRLVEVEKDNVKLRSQNAQAEQSI